MRIIPLSSIQSARNQQQHYPERTGIRLRTEGWWRRRATPRQPNGDPDAKTHRYATHHPVHSLTTRRSRCGAAGEPQRRSSTQGRGQADPRGAMMTMGRWRCALPSKAWKPSASRMRQPPTSRSPTMLMVCARASSNVIWQNSDLQRAGIIVVAELLSWLCLQTRFRQILEGARIVDRLVAKLLQRFSGKCRAPA